LRLCELDLEHLITTNDNLQHELKQVQSQYEELQSKQQSVKLDEQPTAEGKPATSLRKSVTINEHRKSVAFRKLSVQEEAEISDVSGDEEETVIATDVALPSEEPEDELILPREVLDKVDLKNMHCSLTILDTQRCSTSPSTGRGESCPSRSKRIRRAGEKTESILSTMASISGIGRIYTFVREG